MATYRYIQPIDQPTGTFRLIDWLEGNFLSNDFDHFYCLVAFAKIKPFYKLHYSIQGWNHNGKASEAVIGIDHKGTSLQALQYAMACFDDVKILHADHSTFHPKLYIFSGANKASVYYGSSNFTSGGLETNFEGGVIIDFDLPIEQQDFDELFRCYSSVAASQSPCLTKLTPNFLNALNAQGLLLDETKKVKTPRPASSVSSSLFGNFTTKPARPIPGNIMVPSAASAGIVLGPVGHTPISPVTPAPVIVPVITDGFVIQVIPHHNGEILLSKLAVEQNKAFFGFPFTGNTTPKKKGNPSYPQRVPDPVVNIRVFDKTGKLVNIEQNYALNTIYYKAKSEIRITITPSILNALNIAAITTDYPILVMRNSSVAGCDYDLDFYAEGSTDYKGYLSICDQSLPSGGKPVARKMGWI